jgi:hypothetical protein
MKSFAFMVAFALLALTVPASAAEISTAAPVTLEQLFEGPAPLEMGKPPLVIVPYCWTVHGTSCTEIGATRACTDVCSSQLSCTCTYDYSNPSVWYWYCDLEC